MCDPATIITAASLAISVGSEVASAAGQNKASNANKAAALKAQQVDLGQLNLRKTQETDTTSLTISQADRQARQADALAKLSAGEAGVSGASVDALLGDIDAQLGTFKTTEKRNLDMTIQQIDKQAEATGATAQSRIAAVPPSNPFATALAIAGHGVDFANTIRQRKDSLKSNG